MIDPISMAKTLQFVKSGALSARPDKGEFAGQMYFATDVFHTLDILQIWDGHSWRNVHYVHKDVQDDLEAIAARQTWTIQAVVERSGRHTFVKAGKHPRLRILSAYAQLGDIIKESVTVQLGVFQKHIARPYEDTYISNSIVFKESDTEGQLIPFEIIDPIMGFWKDIDINVRGSARILVSITVESAEGE